MTLINYQKIDPDFRPYPYGDSFLYVDPALKHYLIFWLDLDPGLNSYLDPYFWPDRYSGADHDCDPNLDHNLYLDYDLDSGLNHDFYSKINPKFWP